MIYRTMMAALAALLAQATIIAQVGNPPAWYTFETAHGQMTNHPSLDTVDAKLRRTIRDENSFVQHGPKLFVHYHPLHGELAVFDGKTYLGEVQTGLQYVLSVRSVRNQTNPVTMRGVMVIGILANGVSRVLYSPWVETTTLAQASFSSLLPDSAVGERYIVGDIVENRAYIVRGVSKDVAQFIDTDFDGLPDSLGPLTPLPLLTSTAPRTITGFYRSDGEDRVSCAQRSLRRRRFYQLVDSNGQLAFVKSVLGVLHPAVPYLQGHTAVAGLKRVRIRYRKGETVEVICNGKSLAKVIINSANGVATVSLSRRLKVGAEFVLRSGTLESEPVTITAKRPVIFQGDPYQLEPNASIILTGGNFVYQDISVEMAIDDGAFAPVQYSISDNAKTTMVIQPPTPSNPPVPLQVLTIRIQRTSSPETTRAIKRVLIISDQ